MSSSADGGCIRPLADSGIDQQAQLETHFTGPKWKGHCYKGIDEETAAFVDTVLAASPLTSQLMVDREQLAMSDEAWIHVTICRVRATFERQATR